MGGDSAAAGSALVNVHVSQAPTASQQRKQEHGASMASGGAAASGLSGQSLGAAHRFELRLGFFEGTGRELGFEFSEARLRDTRRRGAEPMLDERGGTFEFLEAQTKKRGAVNEREAPWKQVHALEEHAHDLGLRIIDAARVHITEQLVDFGHGRRLEASDEERRGNFGGLRRSERGFGTDSGLRDLETHASELEVREWTHDFAGGSSFEKFTRTVGVINAAFVETEGGKETRVAFAARIRRDECDARGLFQFSEEHRLALDATNFGIGGVAEIERRGFAEAFAFFGAPAEGFVIGKIEIPAQLEQHVFVADSEAFFEHGLCDGLFGGALDEGDEAFLETLARLIKTHVDKGGGLFGPLAADGIARDGVVVFHSEHAATKGASGKVILSPTPPVECLSAVGRSSADQFMRSPELIIAFVQREISRAFMPFNKIAMSRADICSSAITPRV